MINKITQDMVGLKFHILRTMVDPEESNEFIVNVRFEELTDEGIELFGLSENDFE